MSYLAMARRVLNEQTREAEKTTKETKKVLPICVECGDAIGSFELECWWGTSRVHRRCGEAAWRREWQGQAVPVGDMAAH